jgi:hypothetical protein
MKEHIDKQTDEWQIYQHHNSGNMIVVIVVEEWDGYQEPQTTETILTHFI